MAVNASLVTKIPTGERAELGAGSAPGTAIKIFQASMLPAANTAVDAGIADDGTNSIPSPGDTYSTTWSGLIAQRAVANKIGSGALYQITVPYKTTSITISGISAQNPTSRDVVYHEFGQPTTLEVDRDYNGNILENSAGQVLKANVQHADLYIQAILNTSSNNNWTPYFTHTNSGSKSINGTSYAAHALLLSHVDKVWTEEQFEGQTVVYYKYTFHFYVRFPRGTDDPADWRYKILNQGTVELADSEQVALKDANGNIITEPRNLDDEGVVVAPGGTPWWLSSANSYSETATSRVQMYQTANFGSLPV